MIDRRGELRSYGEYSFPSDKDIVFLLVLIGSYGDVVPPLVAFQQIEHLLPDNCNIQVLTHPDFESYVNDLGFGYSKISDEPIEDIFVHIRDLYSPNPLKMFKAGQKQFLHKERHRQWIEKAQIDVISSFDDDALIVPILNSYSEIILRLLFDYYIKFSANHMVVAEEGDPEYFIPHFVPGEINQALVTKIFQKLTVNNQTRVAMEILGELGIPAKEAELKKALIANSEFLFGDHVLDNQLVELTGYPMREDECLDVDLENWLTEQKEHGNKVLVINTGSLSQNPDIYAEAIKKAAAKRKNISFLIVSAWQGVSDLEFTDNVLLRREFTPLIPLLESGMVDGMIGNGGIGVMHLASMLGVPTGAFTSFLDQKSMIKSLENALNNSGLRRGEKKIKVPNFSAEKISSKNLLKIIDQLLDEPFQDRFDRLSAAMYENREDSEDILLRTLSQVISERMQID